MDGGRFETLAQTYGADLRRWPPDERDAAREVRETHPELWTAALAEADALDVLLDFFVAPAASPALQARILARAPRGRAQARARWLAGFGVGAALATSCAAGLAAGLAVAPTAFVRERLASTDPADEAARLLRGPDRDITEG